MSTPSIRSVFCAPPPLVLPTSPPLHLQFQPSVQLVRRRSQEAGGGGAGERQVQCAHQSDPAVCEEEEQHPAAAAQRQEQGLRFPQRGVSLSGNTWDADRTQAWKQKNTNKPQQAVYQRTSELLLLLKHNFRQKLLLRICLKSELFRIPLRNFLKFVFTV